MKTFSYVAKDISGKTFKGVEQAENKDELVARLHQKNLFCLSYKEHATNVDVAGKFRFKTKDVAVLSRQLSSMLSSGITLVRALDILQKQQQKTKPRKEMLMIYEEVQKGRSLSDTLSTTSNAFPPLFVSMVNAGEISGSLDTIMSRVSDHYAKDSKLVNKVKGAMTYPIILVILMIAIVIGLFTFIMPMFLSMFDTENLPALTKTMLSISNFFQTKWYILIIVAVILVVGAKFILKQPSVKMSFDKMKIKLPKIGGLVTTIYTARFARTMSNLYSSGIPMVDCIEKSIAVLSNSYITKAFETVIEDVKQGESLSVSISRANVFSSMFTSIVYVGEESGSLDDILTKTADFYDEEADTAISSLVTMIEPVMLIIMGILVGFIIASILPALTSSMGNVENM